MKRNIAVVPDNAARKVNDDSGRVAIVRSVSMNPEDWRYVHERVDALRPMVKDRSHYMQLLVNCERNGEVDILKSARRVSAQATPPAKEPSVSQEEIAALRVKLAQAMEVLNTLQK